jgi:hypothetical protein
LKDNEKYVFGGWKNWNPFYVVLENLAILLSNYCENRNAIFPGRTQKMPTDFLQQLMRKYREREK